MLLITLYLAAIIIANLLVTHLGPEFSIVSAFLFIGLDLTTRDRLHDQWKHDHLFTKMALLIASGSLLSFLINSNSKNIAIASFVAFLTAALIDTLIYHALRHKNRMIRTNASNIPAAAADSLIFPFLAFGSPLLIPIVIGQFLAKSFGGLVWSILLRRTHVS